MPTSAERRFEALTRLLDRLARKVKRGVPIMVEGRKDLHALKRLGIRGEVILVKNSGKVLADLLDGVQSRSVVVFVDFDEEGVALAKDIAAYLEGCGVKADLVLWRAVGSLVRRYVKDVEGLPSFLEKLKKWAGS